MNLTMEQLRLLVGGTIAVVGLIAAAARNDIRLAYAGVLGGILISI